MARTKYRCRLIHTGPGRPRAWEIASSQQRFTITEGQVLEPRTKSVRDTCRIREPAMVVGMVEAGQLVTLRHRSGRVTLCKIGSAISSYIMNPGRELAYQDHSGAAGTVTPTSDVSVPDKPKPHARLRAAVTESRVVNLMLHRAAADRLLHDLRAGDMATHRLLTQIRDEAVATRELMRILVDEWIKPGTGASRHAANGAHP